MNFTNPFTRPPVNVADLADVDPLTYRPDPIPFQDPLRHEIILLQGETREGTNSKARPSSASTTANLPVPCPPNSLTPAKAGKSAGNSATCSRVLFRHPAMRAAAKVFLELHGIQYNRLFLK